VQTTIQYLAVRLRHDLSWVRNACSEDRRAGDGGRHERTMKSEAAWCKVIASCCSADSLGRLKRERVPTTLQHLFPRMLPAED